MAVIAKESKEKNIIFSVWIKKKIHRNNLFPIQSWLQILEWSGHQQGYMNCATEK